MAIDNESFNRKLYDLLKVRGYKPTPLSAKNQKVQASQNADVIEFTFMKDNKDYGKVWVSIDDAQDLIVYYDNEQEDSPDVQTPGLEYDDTWLGFLKMLKQWAQRRQMSFELANKDRLGDDMKQREHYKMKEKIGESYHPMGKKASYNDAVPNVKIVLQHNRALEEGEQRYRNVAKIYLENVDGERFLAPTTRPGIARVYARHIAEGGVPNDDRWNHIKGICEEYNKMGGFVRATRNGQFNESVQAIVAEGVSHYNNLRESLNKLTGHRGYNMYFESWTPTLMEDEGSVDISEMFMSSSLDPRIESVMPILSRLHKNVSEAKEVDELAAWADNLVNETLELDEDFKNWEFEMEPGDRTKVISGDHKGLRGTVVKKHNNGESYSIKDKDGKVTRHHISTLDRPINLDEAPGAQTLKHNQSTEEKNLKAFGLAEEEEVVWKGEKPWKKKFRKDKDKIEEADGESLTSNNPVGIPEGWDDPSAKMEDDIKVWQDKDELGHGEWFWTRAKNGHIVDRGGPCSSREEAESDAGLEELEEDLGPEQKRVGQLGPTEKIGKKGTVGKLVGSCESKEHDDLHRLMDIVRFRP